MSASPATAALWAVFDFKSLSRLCSAEQTLSESVQRFSLSSTQRARLPATAGAVSHLRSRTTFGPPD
jgi:hypothetical protein